MIDIIQAIIMVTVESLCCKIFFDSFLENRFGHKKYINTILLLGMIATSAFFSIIPIEFSIVKSMGVIVMIILFMGIYYKGSRMQILFCTAGFYGILVAIDKMMLTTIQYVFLYQFENILQDPIRVTLLALLCKAILFMSVVVLNRKLKRENSFNLIADTEWLRFLFFPILTIMTMFIFVINQRQKEKYLLLISFGMIVGNFVIFYMIKDIVYREKKVQEMLVAQERTKNQTEMYIQINQNYEEQKLKIHEFKHHINCIHGLLNAEQNIRALEYVKNINESWVEEMDYVLTNHAIVNAVLNEKYKKAKKFRIPIIMSINNLENLCMKEEDLVTLLANILDNAIEAVEKIKSGEKNIKFRMIYEDKKLVVSVRNPTSGNIHISGKRILTSKDEKENHGFGMKNIDRVVKKYGGEYVFSCKRGYFTSTAIIRNI